MLQMYEVLFLIKSCNESGLLSSERLFTTFQQRFSSFGFWTEKKNDMVVLTDIGGKRQHNDGEVNKPLPILKYNICMKGVDRGDQFMSYYPFE